MAEPNIIATARRGEASHGDGSHRVRDVVYPNPARRRLTRPAFVSGKCLVVDRQKLSVTRGGRVMRVLNRGVNDLADRGRGLRIGYVPDLHFTRADRTRAESKFLVLRDVEGDVVAVGRDRLWLRNDFRLARIFHVDDRRAGRRSSGKSPTRGIDQCRYGKRLVGVVLSGVDVTENLGLL